MGNSEYWIVDYLALGGRRFIGNPKQPTISVYQLVDGEYQVSQFRGNNPIESPAFPEFNLTVEHIFRAGSISYNKGLSLPKRLEVMRRFATDRNMSVKEYAWYFLRPYLIADLPKSFELLIPWVQNPDPNIRRCAVEATRPRGVWCQHIPALKSNPELGLTILEFVRSDPSKYVQRSVGNWLNDASKSRPNWQQ